MVSRLKIMFCVIPLISMYRVQYPSCSRMMLLLLSLSSPSLLVVAWSPSKMPSASTTRVSSSSPLLSLSLLMWRLRRGVAEPGEAEQALSPAYLGVIYDNIEARPIEMLLETDGGDAITGTTPEEEADPSAFGERGGGGRGGAYLWPYMFQLLDH